MKSKIRGNLRGQLEECKQIPRGSSDESEKEKMDRGKRKEDPFGTDRKQRGMVKEGACW